MKKVMFSLMLITALVLSISAVSAHHYWNDYTYEKRVVQNPWGKTVEIHKDSWDSSLHYYKSTSHGYHTARAYDSWGYHHPRPYYSDQYYRKTYKTSYHPYYYDRARYYNGDYWRWRY